MTNDLLELMTPVGGNVYLAELPKAEKKYLRKAFHAQVRKERDQWGEYAPVCKDLMRVWEDGNSMNKVLVLDLRPALQGKNLKVPVQFMGWALGPEGAKIKAAESFVGASINLTPIEQPYITL